ncbi:hypothetical protein A4D02_00045 [Niastella koreensis]|uniref:3-keto-disaccharide hydrolase domain-containing protein n=2 Tax=Niastella koreensis TaxID=354356 RepID=G8TA04_NIAKG|nr:hypothetical protein [Niastella koreensis]AEW02376.1 hypothetical protein Niako_6151 [Niastella koreensis GR20-10]OQP54755.1 hypothetical protein A4D02_00045 [Niastella koreensis]
MNPTFKKFVLILLVLPLITLAAVAQKKKAAVQETTIPMEPAYWQYDSAGVEFIMNKNVKAIHLKGPSPLVLKNGQFSNGTIEYDVEIVRGFPGITFRESADRKNSDQFYLRYFGTTSPESRTTIQYAAVIDGMSMWDLTDEYQAGTTLNIPGWNHVKLIISGKQLKAFVNNMTRPALIVPALEGTLEKGGIAFSGGNVTIANLVIKPDVVENLDPNPGYISTYNDTRYLRNWQVSNASDFSFGNEILPPFPYVKKTSTGSALPDSATQWTPIWAEVRGNINLTRILGHTDFGKRRFAWLKTTIESDSAQERVLHLGFSDEVSIFVNREFLYSDKNYFGTPGQKFPNGRCTIENTTVRLPLKKGKNEILIGLANFFYGWGIVARLDDTEGIHLPK